MNFGRLLRSRANAPLQQVEFLDLSNLGLVSVEKLNTCPKLQTLNLRGNSIVEVVNLEENRNLWNLDLSNNEIKDLDCLSKFVAMGMVNLANNDLTWAEVAKLRNTHILELNLHGNKQLEKDPYYRIHVIDCLPNIWMLDGRMVTSAERLQVKHFFADSALTEHPIRKKLTKEWFVPSSLKKIDVNGIYGEKATHMMIRFPASGPSNVDSDRRRLKYLAHNVEDDLVLEKKYSKRDFQVLKYRRTFIQDILEARSSDRERCNMLVLLLVATLEFVMPTHLVKETLEVAKLSKIGRVYSMDLFLLPKDIRCRIVCILLGAVKVDKDTKEDGGLYDRLYLCLFYTVAELAKLSNSIFGKQNVPTFKMTQLYRDYKCLLASEIVQLLCIVPAFFEYIERDVGVMNLLVTATGDPMITEKVAHLTNSVLEAGGDTKKLYEELSDFLLQRVQEQSLNLNNKKLQISHEEQVITNTKSIPMKSPRSPLDAADFHMKGVSSPNLDPPSVLSARRQAEREKKHFPRLGDYLLLGPQTLGKVIGLPQPFVAHVAMDSIPVANGAMESKLRESEDHYTYVNMDQLDYDNDLGFWKPRGSIGDNMLQEFLAYSNGVSRFTIHTLDDLRKELNRRANLVGDQLPRPNSPEESRGYVGSPTLTGRDTATPLLFSSGRQSMAEDLLHRRTNTFQAEYTPRPMTSVLKEKMDLKVDFSSVRRVQSARPMEQPIHNSPEPSPDTKDDVLEKNSPECLHCVLDAAEVTSQQQQDPVKVVEEKESNQSANTNRFESKPDETQKEETSQQSKESEGTREPQQAESTSPGPVPNGLPAEEGPKGTTPSLTGASQDVPQAGDQAIVHSEEEPELQILVTSRLEGPTSALGNKVMNQGAKMEDINTKKSNSSLKINIPQMELHEEAYDSARKGRPPHMQGRQTFNTARVPLKTGKLSMQGKNRPFSAMDAYRYIVEHPRKPIGSADNLYNTSYQQQRMEAWRKSASTTASHSHTPRQGTPPPQRPPSPDNKSRPGSGVTVTRANDWLAGGRDLFWESLQKRPRSGHVPGWKEGLPDSMKRPRSAVAARTLNRQSKRSHPVTPSSLAYDAMMQELCNTRKYLLNMNASKFAQA